MLNLKKGDKVIYLSNMPYILANGQSVSKEGEELFIQSNVNVQKKFFRIVEEKKEEKVKEVLKPELSESPKKDLNKKDDKKIDNKSKKKNAK